MADKKEKNLTVPPSTDEVKDTASSVFKCSTTEDNMQRLQLRTVFHMAGNMTLDEQIVAVRAFESRVLVTEIERRLLNSDKMQEDLNTLLHEWEAKE